MKHTKRILAIVLVLCMVMSILPMTFAAEKGDLTSKTEVLEGKKKTSKSLDDLQGKDSVMKRTEAAGFEADEKVRAIVVFEDAALTDEYSAEEIRANKAADVQARLSDAHDLFFKNLPFEAKRISDYTVLFNGMAISTDYANLAALEKMEGVASVYVSNWYAAPEVETPEMAYANEITGARFLQMLGLKGEGMLVAVLDTGLNVNHEAFQDYGILGDDLALTKEEAESAATSVQGKWLSDKVPWSYDYYFDEETGAEPDDDVTDYNGHGSHVAGTIAGYVEAADGAVTFCGAAPAAQIVFCKIFDDENSGTYSDIYFSALEDCYVLGVDAFNMSIGSDSGFAWDPELDTQLYGHIFKKLDEAGILASISAGNSFSLAQDNLNYMNLMYGTPAVKPFIADYGVVGSPSTYEGNLSIASVENIAYPADVMIYDEVFIAYNDSCDDGVMGWMQNFGGKTLEFVDCGLGADQALVDLYLETEGTELALDFTEEKIAEVAGKIALIQRGTISFEEKVEAAAKAGAIGVIVYNNQAGSILMSIETFEVPAVSISQEDGAMLLAGEAKVITVSEEKDYIQNPSAYTLSTFSSWGVAPDMTVKPNLTAPGGMIYSAVAGESDAYEVYSGTSMAAPNATGAFLLVLQALKLMGVEDKAERAELAEKKAMSTADILEDAYGYPVSPRGQGAGVFYADYAAATYSYFEEPLVTTKDDPEKTGVYTYKLAVTSEDDEEFAVYPIFLNDYLFTPDGENLYNSITSDYLYLPGSLEDYATVEYPETIAVAAGETVEFEVTLTLGDEIKEYFDAYYPNGAWVDGYVMMYGKYDDIHAGTVSFYGDWTQQPTLDEYTWMDVVDADYWLNTTAADAEGNSYADLGYTSLNLLEMNLGFTEGYAYATALGQPLTYLGDNYFHYTPYDKAHNAISTEKSNTQFYFSDLALIYPMQLRNCKHLVMTVVDAETGEIYMIDDTQYLPKAIYDDANMVYLQTGSFYWDGYVSNESSEYYNDYVPSGTEVYMIFQSQLDYTGAALEQELVIPLVVDYTAPVVEVESLEEIKEEAMVGDVMGDGKVSATDASEIMRYLVDSVEFTEEQTLLADVDQDGSVTAADASLILRYVVGIVDSLPTIVLSESKILTFSVSDNHYLQNISIYDDLYEYLMMEPDYSATEDGKFTFTVDLNQVEGNLWVEPMDYATNWPSYYYDAETNTFIDDYSMTEEKEYTALNDVRAALEADNELEEEVTVQGTVIFKSGKEVYIQTAYDDLTNEDEYYAMDLYFNSADEVADLNIGDVILVTGTTDMYYGIPELKNCTIVEVVYEDTGDWAEIWYDDSASLTDLAGDYFRNYICSLVWLEDLEIVEVTENSDGTVTYQVTDGTTTTTYFKGVAGGEVGGYVGGFFIVSSYSNVMQLRTFDAEYVMFY